MKTITVLGLCCPYCGSGDIHEAGGTHIRCRPCGRLSRHDPKTGVQSYYNGNGGTARRILIMEKA